MEILFLLLQVFWLLLPASIANIAPVLAKPINFLNIPIDGGRTWNGKPIFGSHKTVRGFVFGVAGAILTAHIQVLVYPQTESIALVNYPEVNAIWLGFLLGLGALIGDSVKSFFKRRVGIVSGKEWWGFDQTDWVIGGFVFLAFYIQFSWTIYLTGIVFLGLIHPVVNLVGYALGLKANKF